MTTDDFRETIMDAAKSAADGTLTDTKRVLLYRLALAIAVEELYTVETHAKGSVNPGILMILQQIAMICSDKDDILAEAPQDSQIEIAKPKLEIVQR